MKIIINTSLMVPIYEQIVDQIKMLIRNGELKENDNLPSVRTLSKELKISALTVKKAYDNLESEGFTVTVHGKGTYVAATNTELQYLKKSGVRMMKRAEVLGMLSSEYKTIACAGTHGKTTTSCMVSHLLQQSSMARTASISGPSASSGTVTTRAQARWKQCSATE